MFFAADDGVNGEELWRFDGGPSVSMFWDIHSGSPGSSPLVLGVVNRQLVFAANDSDYGQELWTLSLLPGVEDLPSEIVKVYPNPCINHFSIQNHSSGEISEFQIFKMHGQMTETIRTNFEGNIRINSDITNGEYTLLIHFKDGRLSSGKLEVLRK